MICTYVFGGCHVFERDRITCSKYDNHARLNNQHNWGNLYYHLKNTTILTLIMNKIFIWALKTMKKVVTASIWICKPSHTNCMFHIQGVVGYLRNVTIYHPPTFRSQAWLEAWSGGRLALCFQRVTFDALGRDSCLAYFIISMI